MANSFSASNSLILAKEKKEKKRKAKKLKEIVDEVSIVT